MSFVTQIFKKQKRVYFTYIWRGLALMAIGIYAGIVILKNGMGNAVQSGGGANVLLRKLMSWMSEIGINAQQLLPFCMVAVFGIIAAIGLFNVVRGVWLMAPTHTLLGKSLLQQLKAQESFSDVIDSINEDMQQEPYVFGSVNIGRKWIVDTEAMRLADIRGVFWFDQAMEDYVLCCVDEAQNIWAASLRYKAERDKAAEYLKTSLPDAASGDKEAYIAFLSKEQIAEKTYVPVPPPTLTLPPNAALSFISAEGIPTSNFTYETLSEALHSLDNSSSIALKVLTRSMVSEIAFLREDSSWSVAVIYKQDDEDCRAVQAMDEKQAQSVLESIIKQKKLPDFFIPT